MLRDQILEAMGALRLHGMKSSMNEVPAAGIKQKETSEKILRWDRNRQVPSGHRYRPTGHPKRQRGRFFNLLDRVTHHCIVSPE